MLDYASEIPKTQTGNVYPVKLRSVAGLAQQFLSAVGLPGDKTGLGLRLVAAATPGDTKVINEEWAKVKEGRSTGWQTYIDTALIACAERFAEVAVRIGARAEASQLIKAGNTYENTAPDLLFMNAPVLAQLVAEVRQQNPQALARRWFSKKPA